MVVDHLSQSFTHTSSDLAPPAPKPYPAQPPVSKTPLRADQAQDPVVRKVATSLQPEELKGVLIAMASLHGGADC